VPIAVLEANRRAAIDQLLAMRERRRNIVRVPQRGDRHAEQFGLAPAEDRGRCRIDRCPIAVEFCNADQIVGYAP
jgi:hypothetical protein